MTTFTMTIAQNIYDSNEQFPINFDDAWQWLGYSRKDNAKRTLVKNFERDFDFLINEEATTTGISHIPTELIYISIDCFKQLAMMSKTDIGKVARKYFLECEKIAKEASAAKPTLENPNQGLWNEICLSAHRKAFKSERSKRGEGTHGEFAVNLALSKMIELNPTYNTTVRGGMFRTGVRLEEELDDSMLGEHCASTIVKQMRQEQLYSEGSDSVPEHLLTNKERKDKQKALENNPSSKEHLLPKRKKRTRLDHSKADLKTLKNLPIAELLSIQGTNNSAQFALPEGYIIDIPLDNIY